MKLLSGSANCSDRGEQIECNAINNETKQLLNTGNVDYGIPNLAGTAKNFCIQLPWPVYLSIRPASDEQPQRLKPVWCKVFYDLFHSVWPQCSLSFTGHHMRLPTSRKQKSAFLKAYAKCKVKGCIKVKFAVQCEPVPGEDVLLCVTIGRECTHDMTATENTLHKRHLTGRRRKCSSVH